ncbi:MAG: hypothetical protein L0Y58_10305 [Verrucomicrobia subdivision 3 bacterium]|nr:hypothetical protein [Limisphaerales bacterium]
MARNPLATSFAISLVIHAAIFSTWRIGKTLGWWNHQATWMLKLRKTSPLNVQAKQAEQQRRQREIPMTFVEVDPTTSGAQAPEEAKFYGAANAKAANPDATVETFQPKVDGEQTQIVKADTTLRPQPLQPSLPPPEPEVKPQPEPKADLSRAADAAILDAVEPKRERPRTLAAARAQRSIAGEKMKQDAGTRTRGKVAFDVKATPFGSYDAAFIAAVQQRWYDLIDSTQFAQRSGKVVIEFRLSYDGRISDLRVAGNDVGEMLGLLCQRAILDPAPYQRWPDDMRRFIGDNHRDIKFTFYYN